ncbi:MAG: T9SS type A sorting domain-containing protein, partial [Ferruginibacter sp.]
SGINTGTGIAFNTYVVDSLPSNVSYVPNSLEVVNAPGVTAGIKTDASDSDDAFVGTSAGRTYLKFFIGNNWTSSAGGELPPLSSYILRFKVKVGSIAGSVTNTARITSNSQAGDLFVDDGTAVISPDGGPIPIKFSSFTAVLSGNNGRLEWTTEFEFNNDHFEIERSYDAITFANRGVVASSGNSSIVKHYSYIDPINRTAGIIYYRLKIVDHDGMISYSKIIALKLNGSTIGDFAVYPNPFQGQINVLINSIINEDVLFKIITSLGRELVQHTIQLQKGENVVVLKNLQAIPAGIYILEATTTSGKQFRKIIKR